MDCDIGIPWVLFLVALLGLWLVDLGFNCCYTVGIISVVPGYCYCTVVILSVIYLSVMASRKRSKNAAGSSSSQAAYDENLFVSLRAFERYKLLSGKNVI